MSLYRKYRPQTFADVVGQSHVTQTLLRAIELERLTHAYLFTGPRGTGKTSTARILAKAINCPTPKSFEPCNECELCTDITDGRLVDLIEIDAASNRGIDEIRDLREKIAYAPTRAKAKVYIIDEVHMLTKEAFNALLKTLEEPPEHVYFILATTEVHKIPETILSRCQRFDFRRMAEKDAIGRLIYIAKGEGIVAEDEALKVIAHHSEGGMRDAIGLLEQLATEKSLNTEDVCRALGVSGASSLENLYGFLEKKAAQDALTEIQALYDQGHDLYYFTKRFLEFLRKRMHESVNEGNAAKTEWLLGVIGNFQKAYEQARFASIVELPLELAIVKSCLGVAVKVEPAVAAKVDSSASPTAPTRQPAGIQSKQDQGVQKSAPEVAGTPQPTPSAPPPSKSVASSRTHAAITKEVPTEQDITKEVPRDQDLSIEEVKKSWEKVVAMVENPIAKRSLKQASPLRVEGKSELILGYANRFHIEKLLEAANRAATEKALFEIFNIEMKVVCEISENLAPPKPKPVEEPQIAAEPQESNNNQDLGAAVMDMFEGEMV